MVENTARNAESVRKYIRESSQYGGTELSSGAKGSITFHLNQGLGCDENRRAALGWLFGRSKPISSKELTESEWYGLFCWVGVHSNDTGQWVAQPMYATEAALVLTEAAKWYGTLPKSAMLGLQIPDKMFFSAVDIGGVAVLVTDDEGKPLYDDIARPPWEDFAGIVNAVHASQSPREPGDKPKKKKGYQIRF